MSSFKHFVHICFFVVHTGYFLSAGNDPYTLKVHLNGTWKLPIRSNHSILNAIISRVLENGTFLESFGVNSDETPHIFNKSYENRTKARRSKHGKAVDILVSNAISEDGGMWSARVLSAHGSFTRKYTVFVIGGPTTPNIFLNDTRSKIKEGGYLHFTCSSQSTTTPKSSDRLLQYIFYVNGVNITDMTAEGRYMVRDNKIMIADISEKDAVLNITCTVWEEGLFSNKTRSFTLNIKGEMKYEHSDQSIHIEQRQFSRQQDANNCVCRCESTGDNTSMTVMVTIWSIVTAILIVTIIVLWRRKLQTR